VEAEMPAISFKERSQSYFQNDMFVGGNTILEH